MTRLPEEVWSTEALHPRLPVVLTAGPLSYDLARDGEDRIWANGPDLHLLGEALYQERKMPTPRQAGRPLERLLEEIPVVRRQLVLVTGSHHYLAFWVEDGPTRELRQLPFVYLLGSSSWAPREEVFLQPPDALPHIARWNANCIQCHAVAGQPGESEWQTDGRLEVSYRSRVAELGIACEACHGPAEDHTTVMKNPLDRWRASRFAAGDGPLPGGLVNPAKLSAEQEGAICGQCHAYFVPREPDAWWDSGYVGLFLPGQTLEGSRNLLLPDPDELRRANLSESVESFFWGDGSIRVGGREYNGLLRSPCFEQGSGERKLRCTSCHSLHEGSRDDQLNAASVQDPDAACKDCHDLGPEHSGHRPSSPGASCVNCHMPKTTYALLKSIRSHRISSPSHRLSDPPSACVLCHVDQSERWQHEALDRLFPAAATEPRLAHRPAPGAEGGATPLAFALERAISGDAAERAIFAATLGSPETLATVAPTWPRVALGLLRQDPYAAVRRIAERSLSALPPSPVSGAELPPLAPEALQRALSVRDERPVVISE